MASDSDRYQRWYTDKLWQLLPAIYRAEDSDKLDERGPLEEMVARIGAQMAVVRRSVDRLWEDQSIETCDDWLIDYLGDLVATNLVASLDARGRRLDVRKTIYYRRRKGTVALLEELATDITGWGARVVEFFRRLGRTRHGLDPAIGVPALPLFSSITHTGASTGTLRIAGAPLDDHSVAVRIDVAGQAGAASWSTSIDGGDWVSHATASAVTLDAPGGGTIAVTLVDGGANPSFVAGDQFSFAVSVDQVARMQRAEGLVGARTRTGAGGFADLRDLHGASLAKYTAFDEYFHTADVRRGRGVTGWHDIPRLGVFVWRLRSLPVEQVTPVVVSSCPNQVTFDPTGRDIPLFAAGDRPHGDQWVSPEPHQLPGPITIESIRYQLAQLYRAFPETPDDPRSFAVYGLIGAQPDLIPPFDFAADPRRTEGKPWIDAERGRIIWPTAPTDGPFLVSYHYGFSSEIGAGAYDRPPPPPANDHPPPPAVVISDPTAVLTTTSAVKTLEIGNSLTYPRVAPIAGISNVVLRAGDQRRPLVRLPTTTSEWVFTGAAAGATLTFDGLFLSGGDLVLAGTFDTVVLSCCTLDPGTWNGQGTPPAWRRAADTRTLSATSLRIRGSVRTLIADRCILGPIVVESGGRMESMTLRESIIQAADGTTLAIDDADGELALSRCTVLGQVEARRFEASECILHDVVTVDDCQHGCVRFSAWATGSALPRRYESVEKRPRAALFSSLQFGQPDYAQLSTAGSDISEGAEDGSEMGAFWRERNAIKERSLLIKYQEYLPLGLEPVIVHVT